VMSDEFRYLEPKGLAPDAWRKLWVVRWRDADGHEFEREHRSRASADAHVFELDQRAGVSAIWFEWVRVK
jgi:hypothetical protein